MIIADENIHSFIITALRNAGIVTISVKEITKGATDESVMQLALQHGYILLTEDKDFGEWVFSHHIKELSVVFYDILFMSSGKSLR